MEFNARISNLEKSHRFKKRLLTIYRLILKKGEVFWAPLGLMGAGGKRHDYPGMIVGTSSTFTSGSVRICGHDVAKNIKKLLENIGAIVEFRKCIAFFIWARNLKYLSRMHQNI